MIAAVSLRVLYLIVSRLLSWLTLLSRATASGHRATRPTPRGYVLRRTNPRPLRDWADRAPFVHSSAACPRH